MKRKPSICVVDARATLIRAAEGRRKSSAESFLFCFRAAVAAAVKFTRKNFREERGQRHWGSSEIRLFCDVCASFIRYFVFVSLARSFARGAKFNDRGAAAPNDLSSLRSHICCRCAAADSRMCNSLHGTPAWMYIHMRIVLNAVSTIRAFLRRFYSLCERRGSFTRRAITASWIV